MVNTAHTASRGPDRLDAVLGSLLILIVTLLCDMSTGLGACGGDGGSPYAAPASPRGRACHVLESLGVVGFFTPVVVYVVARSLSKTPAGRALALAMGLLIPVVYLLVVSSLSPECGAGTAGVDCLHY